MNQLTVSLALTLATIGHFSCAGECTQPIVHSVVVMIDVTDPAHTETLSGYLPTEIDHLLASLEKSGGFQTCSQIKISLYPLNDLGENRGVHITSKAITNDMTPTLIQRQVKEPFRAAVLKGLQEFLTAHYQEAGYEQTRIYEPLCLMLNGSQPPQNILIYSDLIEHNEVSFYRQGKPLPAEETLADLEKGCGCTLPTLSGTYLRLMSFRSRKNDALVRQSRSFFTQILKQRQATVTAGTGLKD